MSKSFIMARIQWWLQYRCDQSLNKRDRALARWSIRKWINWYRQEGDV